MQGFGKGLNPPPTRLWVWACGWAEVMVQYLGYTSQLQGIPSRECTQGLGSGVWARHKGSSSQAFGLL